MALVFPAGGGGVTCMQSATGQLRPPSFSSILVISLVSGRDGGGRGAAQVVGARRGMSSRTRRLEDRGKKGRLTTRPPEEEEEGGEGAGVGDGEAHSSSSPEGAFAGTGGGEQALSAGPMPELPGLQPDFWEGSQWDSFGFVVQYLWAFGVLFAFEDIKLIACGVAVATYNEGATDFKQTPVYKESLQSRDLLEEPDSSSTDVFEANPTEEAPSIT